MESLKKNFPPDVEYRIAYNPTEFIEESIHEVYKTLFEAVLLVVIVVIVFLQSWRTALIPVIAIPVSLVGTFAVMAALGFSLNNLTLFGLVLAIGIVVDDAIVVVEKTSSATWLRGSPPARRRTRPWTRWAGRSSPSPWCWRRCSSRPPSSPASRAILQAVRAHHRGLDHHLGLQLAHPFAGSV